MDGPTLITQPPGYPEERPETDDMDGMLDHLAAELEGKQLLEKPRVSKKIYLFDENWDGHPSLQENAYSETESATADTDRSFHPFEAISFHHSHRFSHLAGIRLACGQVMVFALKEQNRIIGQLRKEANANFMLLDDRSRRTQDLVQKLTSKINAQENKIQKANATIATIQDEVKHMRGKVEEALKLIGTTKKLEEKIVSVQHRVEAHTNTLQAHEVRFDEIGRLAVRVKYIEESLCNISGENVFVTTDHMGEPMALNKVVQTLQVSLTEYSIKIQEQSKVLHKQSEVISKAEEKLAEGVRINRENIEEMQVKLAKNDDIDLADIRRGQTSIAEQLDVIQQELLVKIDKSYVDEHVEARYEEIINHLHKALSSTEEDEQDFKKQAHNLQEIIEQLSASKADRRELLELKQFMVSLNGQERRASLERRSSSGSVNGQNGGNPLTGPITRDEVFNLLEEKADRKDLERRMANVMTRMNNAVLRRGSGTGPAIPPVLSPSGPAGPSGYGGTPAKRGSGTGGLPLHSNNDIIGAWDTWDPDPDGALAMSKQLTDGFGRAVKPDGMAIGTCLSCKAPIVHPDKLDLFPGVSRGGGFQLWAPSEKGPPLRPTPGETLPELDTKEGRHIIGKDGNLYLAQPSVSAAVPEVRAGEVAPRPQTAGG